MAVEPDDDDPETLSAFERLLAKIGPKWLENHLPKPASNTPSLETFLQSALAETKAEAKAMADRMETIREILTPEQWTLLKSRQSPPPGNGDDRKAPKPEPEPKPKKRSWL